MRKIINSIIKYHNESFNNAYLLITVNMVANRLKFNVILCTAHCIYFFTNQITKRKPPVGRKIN